MDETKKDLVTTHSTPDDDENCLDTELCFDLRKRKCNMLLSLNSDNKTNNKYVGKVFLIVLFLLVFDLNDAHFRCVTFITNSSNSIVCFLSRKLLMENS